MKFIHNKIDGTFLLGVAFSNHTSQNKKHTSLIFDIGKHSFAFVFRGQY